MALKPIKRHPALQNLSREHHTVLIFELRLKKGIQKKVDLERLNKYIDWFWNDYLLSHFQLEEKYLFTKFIQLPNTKLAIQQHKDLKVLFENKARDEASIIQLYKDLEKHIRFEERVLFNEIQTIANEEELREYATLHPSEKQCMLWNDAFWK